MHRTQFGSAGQWEVQVCEEEALLVPTEPHTSGNRTLARAKEPPALPSTRHSCPPSRRFHREHANREHGWS